MNKQRFQWLFLIWIGGIFCFLATSVPIQAAEKFPKFFISSLKGKRFNSRKQKTPYIVSFFFTGCEPCIKEIPELHKLMVTEFPQVPLLFMDPLPDESDQEIKEFAEALNVPLDFFYHDKQGRIGKKFFKGQMEFPTIVGIQQRLILFRIPVLDEAAIQKIRNLLK